MRWLIAAIIVLLCSTDLTAQEYNKRIWRVTSWLEEHNVEARSSTRETLAGCIASIKLTYAKSQQHQLYCTADRDDADYKTTNTAAK